MTIADSGTFVVLEIDTHVECVFSVSGKQSLMVMVHLGLDSFQVPQGTGEQSGPCCCGVVGLRARSQMGAGNLAMSLAAGASRPSL